MVNYLSSHFTKEDVCMTDTHILIRVSMCLLDTMELQIQTVKEHFTVDTTYPLEWLKLKRTVIARVGKIWSNSNRHTLWWECAATL